jgi:hypothetical protein
MVRRVDQASASVFLVLREPCSVTLTVHENNGGSPGEERMSGTRATVALGKDVHAVTVTARGKPLSWGQTYLYDLSFSTERGLLRLVEDGVLLISMADIPERDRDLYLVRYPGQSLPSFTLPAEDPAKWRVLYGSCRKPHGAGFDALAYADELIDTAVRSSSVVRPQQLFLTGDQIYADDVDAELLKRVRAFESAHIGTAERAELEQWIARTPKLADGDASLDPGKREALMKEAGFTSHDANNHLVTLGEYVAMYLFAWSLWPWAERLAGFDSPLLERVRRDDHPLSNFVGTGDENRPAVHVLLAVRRALANIATFMMFDDHEVTDDWNLREDWSRKVCSAPFGGRVLRNALSAYAVFQHWGNDPDAFEPGTPGAGVLEALDGFSGAEADAKKTAQLAKHVRVHWPGEPSATDPQLLRWSFRYRGPRFELIALDTRTRRRMVGKRMALLTPEDIGAALTPSEPRADFFIVLSPAPVVGRRWLAMLQRLSGKARRPQWGDDEGWDHADTRSLFQARLLDLAPAVVLSGDVHFGYSVQVKDKKRPGQSFVNFVSSSLRNQSGMLTRLRKLDWDDPSLVLTNSAPEASSAEVEGDSVMQELLQLLRGGDFQKMLRMVLNPKDDDLVTPEGAMEIEETQLLDAGEHETRRAASAPSGLAVLSAIIAESNL